MNAKLFTTGMLIVLISIVVSKYYPLLYYWLALMFSVLFLNTRSKYKKYSLIANSFFFLYICFITWVRTRNYSFSKNAEFWLNNWEHLLFAVVVCLLVSLFISTVINAAVSFAKTLLLTVILFNIIGIINEYFQNIINHRDFFHLTPDSQKDLLMNVFGTVLFTTLALCWHFNKKRLLKKFVRVA